MRFVRSVCSVYADLSIVLVVLVERGGCLYVLVTQYPNYVEPVRRMANVLHLGEHKTRKHVKNLGDADTHFRTARPQNIHPQTVARVLDYLIMSNLSCLVYA